MCVYSTYYPHFLLRVLNLFFFLVVFIVDEQIFKLPFRLHFGCNNCPPNPFYIIYVGAGFPAFIKFRLILNGPNNLYKTTVTLVPFFLLIFFINLVLKDHFIKRLFNKLSLTVFYSK